ncbi:hypothetical protein [Pseudonocardia sp. D17]|uniref:hypothetical protein n=1 Tax=Pseudonocardia sp. D17 TaxID=882661 RepID=UPI002B3DFD1F|nr:hypothetical protein PSD17_55260 [Pseudonocardia sp. D17]
MPDLTDSKVMITPAVVALRKRIRQHLADIEYARMAADDPMPHDLDDALDDVALDELAARLLADPEVERLAAVEDRARGVLDPAAGFNSVERAIATYIVIGDGR